MQELLVILACLSSKGCSETSGAYYQAHPELQEMVKLNERRVKNFVGPIIMESAAPILFLAQGGTGNFKIYGPLSLRVKKYEDTMLVINIGF